MQKTQRKNALTTQPTGEAVETFICRVCGEEFSDGWGHALTRVPSSPFLRPIDEAHARVLKDIPKHKSPCPLCGEPVHLYGNGENWDVTCTGCGYMFDED